MTSIIAKIRNLIDENTKETFDVFFFENAVSFPLSESNAQEVSTVYVNDEELESGQWEYDSDTNRVTLDESSIGLTTDDVIKVEFSYYPNYSDSEIRSYVKNTIVRLSIHNYSTFIVSGNIINPTPTERQENLIALIASVLIRPDNRTYRLPEITVVSPSGSVNTDQRISQIINSFKKDSAGVFTLLDRIGRVNS